MQRASFLMLGAGGAAGCASGARAERCRSSRFPRAVKRCACSSAAARPRRASGQTFTFDGKLYRGTFERTDDGQIVNLVDLEQYLYSVVSREMPAGWPPPALETQAICARTYVLQRSDPRRSYDLVPSELDQLYDGIAGETISGIAAVDATAGNGARVRRWLRASRVLVVLRRTYRVVLRRVG